MKISSLIASSIVAGVLGIFLSQTIFQPLLVSFEGTLDSLNFTDAANIRTWAAIIFTFAGTMLANIAFTMTEKGDIRKLFLLQILVLIYTVVILSSGSFFYLAENYPEVFNRSTRAERWLSFFKYPTLVVLKLVDPEPIWTISTILFIFIWNLVIVRLLDLNESEK